MGKRAMPPHASVSLTVCTRNGTLTRGYTLRHGATHSATHMATHSHGTIHSATELYTPPHMATLSWLPHGFLASWARTWPLGLSHAGSWALGLARVASWALPRGLLASWATLQWLATPFTVSGSGCARSRGRCRSRGPVGRSARSVESNRVARAERATGEERHWPESDAERAVRVA